MKNIAVFKALVIIVCALAFKIPAWGQDEKFSISVAPQFGMLYGQSEEIVYPYNTKATYLSQLLWDLKPMFYSGATLEFSLPVPNEQWGFFSDVSFKIGIPGNTGKMEDRDWQSKIDSYLTNYSVHDNTTSQLVWVEGSAGVYVPVKSRSRFGVSLNLSYMRFAFSASGGYYRYAKQISDGRFAPISASPEIALPSEELIRYTQNWLIIAPAFSFKSSFLSRFSGELFFQVSPMTFCSDLDEHLLTGYQYRDEMRWGLLVEPKGKIAFHPTQWLELSLDLSYRYIFGNRGETYSTVAGSEYTLSGEAGASLSILQTGVLLKVRF